MTTERDISTDEIQGLILQYSKVYSETQSEFLDLALLGLEISRAESNFQNVPNYLYDGEKGTHTAFGIFQLTRTFYKNFCGNPEERKDIEKNIKCAIKVLSQKQGYMHWIESFDLDGKGWKYITFNLKDFIKI